MAKLTPIDKPEYKDKRNRLDSFIRGKPSQAKVIRDKDNISRKQRDRRYNIKLDKPF